MKSQRQYRKRPKNVDKFDENIEFACPECNSTNFEYDSSRAEVICGHCGLILDENIIASGSGRVAYNQEQINKRIQNGAPSSQAIHDGGLATDIGFKNGGSHSDHAKWYRMRKLHKRSRFSNSRQRNLAFALSELDRKSSLLSLPRSIREQASYIYRKALDNQLVRGRTIDGVISASIYIACRLARIPRTLDEIVEVSSSSRKAIGRTHRFLTRELKIKLAPTSPNDYIPRFATELELSDEFQVKAIQIINESEKEGLTNGKGPSGLAAAAIYIASIMLNQRKSQKAVAEVAGVTEVTVRNRYRELSQNLNLGVAI